MYSFPLPFGLRHLPPHAFYHRLCSRVCVVRSMTSPPSTPPTADDVGSIFREGIIANATYIALIAGSLGAVPMYTLVRFPPADAMAGCMLLAVCGGTLATVTGPIVRATLTNVTHGRQRGLAFASFALFDDVGKGAGPALISVLIQSFGRRWTFAAAMWLWVPCAVLNGLTAYTVAADEKQAARMAGGHTVLRLPASGAQNHLHDKRD